MLKFEPTVWSCYCSNLDIEHFESSGHKTKEEAKAATEAKLKEFAQGILKALE